MNRPLVSCCIATFLLRNRTRYRERSDLTCALHPGTSRPLVDLHVISCARAWASKPPPEREALLAPSGTTATNDPGSPTRRDCRRQWDRASLLVFRTTSPSIVVAIAVLLASSVLVRVRAGQKSASPRYCLILRCHSFISHRIFWTVTITIAMVLAIHVLRNKIKARPDVSSAALSADVIRWQKKETSTKNTDITSSICLSPPPPPLPSQFGLVLFSACLSPSLASFPHSLMTSRAFSTAPGRAESRPNLFPLLPHLQQLVCFPVSHWLV